MNKTFWMMMVLLGLTAQAAVADIPGTINYQGRLTDLAGNAVTDGTYGVTFTLHYTAAGNSPTGWSEVQNVVTERGYFSIALGSSTPLSSLGFNYPYYLEIQVAGDAQPMSPRQALSSVPYAMRANDGIPKGAIIMWTGASCPPGYTRLSAFDGMFPRGAASYGTTGGSDTHGHSGSVASGGVDHTHSFSGTTSQPNDTQSVTVGGQPVAGQFHTHTISGTTGNSSAYTHSHDLTINNGNNVPRYFNVIFCLKQ